MTLPAILRAHADGLEFRAETRRWLTKDERASDNAEAAQLSHAADALDKLREAVKGCGEMHYDVGTVGHPCGSRTFSLSGCERIRLCAPCSAKRDAAMARLLGSEIEGDSNG